MLSPPTSTDAHGVSIALHDGARRELWPLFELADDSALAIRQYFDRGLVHVARRGGVAIGHAQIIPLDQRLWELKSLAVLAPYRRLGLGGSLVRRSLAWVREHGGECLLVATASCDLDNLGFYQRRGFRMLGVERDAFTRERGYPDGLTVRGIPVRDRVWLELAVVDSVA